MSQSATCPYAEGATLPKPIALEVIAENIPYELKQIPHWVCWKYEWRDGKWTKPPYQPNGRHAKSNDKDTWYEFSTVLDAYEKGGFDGIGIVLTEDMGIVGIDLDHMTATDAQIYFRGFRKTYLIAMYIYY